MDPEPQPNAGGFALVLTNRHLLDVNIFLQHDGQADRIAMVNASSSKTWSCRSTCWDRAERSV